jgi:hypothetical protein
MNDENNERPQHDPYSFPVVAIMLGFLIFLTIVLGFVGAWSVAQGLIFAGVL